MDTRTGEVMDADKLRKLMGEDAFKKYAKPVDLDKLTADQRSMLQKTGRTKIGPNERCPCGSGKKFKVCCQRLEG